MKVDCGISSIENVGKEVQIEFSFDKFYDHNTTVFKSVIINSEDLIVHYYKDKGFTSQNVFENSVLAKFAEEMYEDNDHIEFRPYDTTKHKLFEYLVFYPYYHILHTVIKKKKVTGLCFQIN